VQKVKKLKMRIKIAILLAMMSLCLAGCNPMMQELGEFNNRYESGNFEQAGQFAEGKVKKGKKPSGNDLLWELQLASSQRARLDHAESIASFDNAEEMLNYYAPKSAVLDTASAITINDNAAPYKGEEYDGIMVNTYKALDFLAEKKPDLARVEFNRALDRQTRAKEHFNEEIRKLEAQLDKEKEKSKADVRATAEDPKVTEILNNNYPNLSQFQPYPDFVNPFTTYLAGVYFLLIGENGRAADLLKETAGMVPDNEYIKSDLILADEAASGNIKVENQCWVIFENGLGPTKGETRIDLPLILVSNRVYYTGVALPKLCPRSAAYPYLTIKTDAGEYRTEQVADMERVIETEFKKDFKGILLRAIASASIKTAAQAVLSNDRNGDGAILAGFLMGVYSAATTAADLRIWTALPKDFQIARFTLSKNTPLLVITPANTLFEVNIPPCNNAIVYIKIVNAGAAPVSEVLTF
jgi:hypothetical protein